MRILTLAALAIGLFGVGVALVFWRADDPRRIVVAEVAQTRFAFPAAYARDEAAAAGGFTDRLALLARFPDFSAPTQTDKTRAARGAGARGPKLVFVTLSTKDDSLDPAERPTRLYARFLEGDVFDGPGGLILRRFERDSPYDLEVLYLAPPDGRGFFARCPKPRETRASAAADLCLTVFRWGELDVELRYEPALLEQWDALSNGAHAFLERIRERPGAAR